IRIYDDCCPCDCYSANTGNKRVCLSSSRANANITRLRKKTTRARVANVDIVIAALQIIPGSGAQRDVAAASFWEGKPKLTKRPGPNRCISVTRGVVLQR